MLKRTIGILLLIALIQTVACVSRTHAVSADIVLTHIQPGIANGATKEYVILYNNTIGATDITNWCLRNKSDAVFACFTPEVDNQRAWLPPHSYAVVVSAPYLETLPPGMLPSISYAPTNQSSGAIVGSGDTVSLIDQSGVVVDAFSWSGAQIMSMLYARKTVPLVPTVYQDTDSPQEWTTMVWSTTKVPADQLLWRAAEVEQDVCINIEGIQATVPDDMSGNEGICEPLPPILAPTILITEVMPNPSGSDTENEFIELYNYGEEPISLKGYMLRYGASADKRLILTNELWIDAQSYLVMKNVGGSFTLPNTAGIVKIETTDGFVVSEAPAYANAKDDQSWALFDGFWRYTKIPTPGYANNEQVNSVSGAVTVVSLPRPCAANQYRHPETQRCRLLATTTSVQTACRPDQYRSVETGRCRNVALATTPTPCKEGQQRSPETNRCRAVRALTTTNYGVLRAEEKSQPDQWYVYAVIGAVLAALLAYALWEWRVEMRGFLKKLRWLVIRR